MIFANLRLSLSWGLGAGCCSLGEESKSEASIAASRESTLYKSRGRKIHEK